MVVVPSLSSLPNPLLFPSPSRNHRPITNTYTNYQHHRLSSSSSRDPPPPVYLKFRTTHRDNLRYLQAVGVIDRNAKPHQLPIPDEAAHMVSTLGYLKSKGFPDSAFSRLAFHTPQLFSLDFHPSDIEPVLEFLTSELDASPQDSLALLTKFPELLFLDVEHRLRPTLDYLRQLGLDKLNAPSTSNARLLSIPVKKLDSKVTYLRSIGFSHEEAARACARLPAIFRYGIDNNLRPKFEFLVWEMRRDVEELKAFPQYFAYSLQNRISPRHLYLKERGIHLPLNKMLLWPDKKFYTKVPSIEYNLSVEKNLGKEF